MKKEQRNLGLGLLKPISYQFRDDIDLTRLYLGIPAIVVYKPPFTGLVLIKHPISSVPALLLVYYFRLEYKNHYYVAHFDTLFINLETLNSVMQTLGSMAGIYSYVQVLFVIESSTPIFQSKGIFIQQGLNSYNVLYKLYEVYLIQRLDEYQEYLDNQLITLSIKFIPSSRYVGTSPGFIINRGLITPLSIRGFGGSVRYYSTFDYSKISDLLGPEISNDSKVSTKFESDFKYKIKSNVPRLIGIPLNTNYSSWDYKIFKFYRDGEVITDLKGQVDYYTITINGLESKYKFKDKILSPTSFIRHRHYKYISYGYLIDSGKVVRSWFEPYVKYLEPLARSKRDPKEEDSEALLEAKNKLSNIIVLDIETYLKGTEHIHYACGFYSSKLHVAPILFYKTDYPGISVIKVMLDQLLIPATSGWYIYAHNLGRYDCVFQLKYLKDYGEVKVLKNNAKQIVEIKVERIIEAKSKKGKKTKQIWYFRDSIKLIDGSQKDIAKAFNVPTQKQDFPHSFVNESRLNYIGPTPVNHYNTKDVKLVNNWDLKVECLDYLSADLKSLYQILESFELGINDDYSNIKISGSMSQPSLFFKIYRKYYQPEDVQIPLIKGEFYDLQYKGYYGALVDVYQCYVEDAYYYDVNSLYPYSMLKDIPVGQPKYLAKVESLDNFFGFVQVKIKSPDSMDIPVQPFKSEAGLITPLGSWDGLHFSEELKEAAKQGYKFELLDGFEFDKCDYVFKSYVQDLYNRKRNAKGVAREIPKRGLNTQYGKTGSSPKIFKTVQGDHKVLDSSLESLVEVDDDYYMVDQTLDKPDYVTCVNVAIAAAITSYSRIHINKYKRLVDNQAIYSDTDSIVQTKPLDPNLITPEIGDMKLEYKIKRGVFLGPKMYALHLENGEYIVKIRGLTSNAKLDDRLLNKEGLFNLMLELYNAKVKNPHASFDDSFKLYQSKFVKDSAYRMHTLTMAYVLKISQKKRSFIVEDGKLITKPREVSNGILL